MLTFFSTAKKNYDAKSKIGLELFLLQLKQNQFTQTGINEQQTKLHAFGTDCEKSLAENIVAVTEEVVIPSFSGM